MKNPARILAGSLIPAIDVLSEDGFCKEEIKMIEETRKIMGMPKLPVFASTVRVPVERGHSEMVQPQAGTSGVRQQVSDLLKSAPGVTYVEGRDYGDLRFQMNVWALPRSL